MRLERTHNFGGQQVESEIPVAQASSQEQTLNRDLKGYMTRSNETGMINHNGGTTGSVNNSAARGGPYKFTNES